MCAFSGFWWGALVGYSKAPFGGLYYKGSGASLEEPRRARLCYYLSCSVTGAKPLLRYYVVLSLAREEIMGLWPIIGRALLSSTSIGAPPILVVLRLGRSPNSSSTSIGALPRL